MKKQTIIRIVSFILLLISLWTVVDTGLNLAASLIPSMNDGIGCWSTVYLLIYGDHNWSQESYLHLFENCCYVFLLIATENIALAIAELLKRNKK